MKKRIRERAVELGIGDVSFMQVQPLPLWAGEVEKRKVMDPDTADYWESRGLVSDCTSIMKNAKTVIAAVYPYKPYKLPFSSDQGSFSAHYAAYPRGRKAVTELGNLLKDEGYEILIDPPVPAKEIAYRSGLGKYGKNGLIYHPSFGSFITIHILLTNAIIAPDDENCGEITDCGNCRLCIQACPTQAIAGNGAILVSKCMRYHMFSSEIIPVEVRERMKNQMLGCEDCQRVCPKNRAAVRQAYQMKTSEEIFSINKLLSGHGTGLKKLLTSAEKLIGKNYARPQKVLSMAVIAAGNSGDPAYVSQLSFILHHTHPPIRAHSAWAIGRLGGEYAKKCLQEAMEQEQDPYVRQEIKAALLTIEKSE